MGGVNRDKTRNNRSRKERRQEHGARLLVEDAKNKMHDNDWNLDWFKPKGLQIDCVESMDKNLFTIVDAPSGCGKTSVALWYALTQIKSRNYDKLIFIKNPTEVGDDNIGFLSGSESDKLMAHTDTTKRIFYEFMSKNKFDNDTSKDRIRLTIPNFLLGATFDHSIIILDETQLMSPTTVKLLTERCGKYSKYIILGDSGQRYAVKKRGDGFEDFIERTTTVHAGARWSKCEPMVGYVKMSRHDNQRSDGSKFINKLYEE